MAAWYQNHEYDAKFDTLTPTMLQKSASTPPKLRGKAAEIRSLVPFVQKACETLLTDNISVAQAAKEMSKLLAGMYECLSATAPFAADPLADRCRRVCLLWVALEQSSPAPLWRVKPKMHLMQELCEESLGERPALSWCYRDEEFGGSLAQLARRRGGAHSALAVANAVILKFISRHPVPRLR